MKKTLTLLDKAIIFATKAHSGAKRKGTNVPYIVHPIEAAAIVSAMTDDQEIIAAAVLHDVLEDHYSGAALVSVAPLGYTEKRIAANTMAGSDRLQLIICGHEDQVLITALFDNLGKGASGAAVQNMNLMLGLEETTGLNL